ncbi:MAG: hypothetical protein NC541_13525 [bacterium]|nr:hypothetical protein [bacterium]
MKYMTFRSSCSYAGVANMLEYYGFDTEDRQIALDMKLPFLFSCQDSVYCAGPMLQTADWFNLYLKPRGFCMTETQVAREEAGRFLRTVSCGMLGLTVTPQSRHAVVYTGMSAEKYRFLNNKRQHAPEPETLLFTEEELSLRLHETVMIATLSQIPPQPVEMTSRFQESRRVLCRLKQDLLDFCSKERTPAELTEGRDRLFRAILLDAVTMLELIGEQPLLETLLLLQRQFTDALREGTPQTLCERLSMGALTGAIDGYGEMIKGRIFS